MTTVIITYLVRHDEMFEMRWEVEAPTPVYPVVGISNEDLLNINPYHFVPTCD